MSTPKFPHKAFSSILESDHATINRGAARLKKALARYNDSPTPSNHATAVAIRDEVIWRLVRHDVSEELVMRPAFERWMGEEGRRVGDGDRKDHGDAKPSLHYLLTTPLSNPTYTPYVHSMMSTLAQHMKRESGGEIPALEFILPRAESAALARAYARTQVLTPALVLEGGVKPFQTLESYIDAPPELFQELLAMVPEGAVADVDGVLIDEGEEMEEESSRKSRL